MKIIVSDDGNFWNSRTPILEQHVDDVIVISYDQNEKNDWKDRYKHLDIIIPDIFGMDENGATNSARYLALCERKEELVNLIGNDKDVLILSDNDNSTVYPYKLLQQLRLNINLHLWMITPYRFETKGKRKAYLKMMMDIDYTKSFVIMDTSKLIKKNTNRKMSELFEEIKAILEDHIDSVCREICNLEDEEDIVYYYDFDNRTYRTGSKYEGFMYDGKDIVWSKMGRIAPRSNSLDKEENQLYATPRGDGKEICNMLRDTRKRVAKANEITLETEECSYKGNCAGTCPVCDEELRYLASELEKIPEDKRIYPKLDIREQVVNQPYNQTEETPKYNEDILMGDPFPVSIESSSSTKPLSKMGSIKIPDFLKRGIDE